MNMILHTAYTLLAAFVLMMPVQIYAQYSDKVFDLKKQSDLYDERGFAQGTSIDVDGKLGISNANGNVSYSYPISSFSAKGYKFETTLNYCGSVGFTTFDKYVLGHAGGASADPPSATPYQGWQKFHQNRPAWILGFNGFAIQAISTSTHFRCDHALQGKKFGKYDFDDKDFIWAMDGYDFCNRMTDFGAKQASGISPTAYTDYIRLLRSDGSVLELMNINPLTVSPAVSPDGRPELYTGYYYSNEANTMGFAKVEFDSTYWTPWMVHDSSEYNENERGPLVPRIVHYYPGDGLEYVFREWTIPFGTQPYYDVEENSGGKFGGPTIFYLEEVRCSNGQLIEFTRSRHYPVVPFFESGATMDSTRGRALMMSFAGHTITYGVNSMVIQAFGRSTQVRFTKVMPSGHATETNWMPIGSNGYVMDGTELLASRPDDDDLLYKSYLGYVDEIIDPEGRSTKFTYKPYLRKYKNFDFPRSGSSPAVTVTLKNYRLEEIQEPTARYHIAYFKDKSDFFQPDGSKPVTDGSDTLTIAHGQPSADNLAALSNVAAWVKKYDKSDVLLTTSRYDFLYGVSTQPTFADHTMTRIIDNISGDSSSTEYYYRRYQLPNLAPTLPPSYYTGLYKTDDLRGSLHTVTTKDFSTTDVPTNVTNITINGVTLPAQTPKWNTPYVILDTAQHVAVNGVAKQFQTTEYAIDTVRYYGVNLPLAGMLGQGVIQQVTATRDAATGSILRKDSTDFLHLDLIDTVMTRYDTLMLKLKMLETFFAMRDAGTIHVPWEQAMYDPRIYEFTVDATQNRVLVPPFYGLVQRQIVKDSLDSIVIGKVNTYQVAMIPGIELPCYNHGTLLNDSIIGASGLKLLNGKYTSSALVVQDRINANGSKTILNYDYVLPAFKNSMGVYEDPVGNIRDNRDVSRKDTLTGALYGNPKNEPLVQVQPVRKYKTDLSLDTLNLMTSFERSYYGLVSGTIDPNGWYSRVDYDKNGRLKTAWLPYDFQSSDNAYAEDIEGYDSSASFGYSTYNITDDYVICDPLRSFPPGPTTTGYAVYDHLYVDNPINTIPTCPSCAEARKDDRSLMGICGDPIAYSTRSPAVGGLDFPVVPEGVTSITSLDSAYIRLLVSSVIGECVTLKVTINALGITQTFTGLNCQAGGSIGDWNGAGTTAKRGDDRTILSGVSGTAGKYLLKIKLNSALATLLTYTPGTNIHVKLETTTPGARIEFGSGIEGEDIRPTLVLKGTFHKVNLLADNTLAYCYNDDSLYAVESSKVDDIRHTYNRIDVAANQGSFRRSAARHWFGADGRVLRTEDSVMDDGDALRIDTTFNTYTGLGRKTVMKDPMRDSIITKYDTAGRPILITNIDGTNSSIRYYTGTPASFGITDQNFYGFCSAKTVMDENGVLHTSYYDAFDSLRREVVDSGSTGGSSPHLNLTTRYDYDPIGRLTRAINPKGDTIRYAYDAFNRVASKTHPDLGIISYAYDKVGNVRFTQSQEQFVKGRLTFNEYDDLNRVTLIGEASLCDPGTSVEYEDDGPEGGWLNGHVYVPTGIPSSAARKGDDRSLMDGIFGVNPCSRAYRLTDLIDGGILHTGTPTKDSLVTANATFWGTPARTVPTFWDYSTLSTNHCLLNAVDTMLNETQTPVWPFLRHPVQLYVSPAGPYATKSDFENITTYPEFARIAIAYDTLPPTAGTVWGNFPAKSRWDSLAPGGQLRNQKGHEAAVAYREHGGEPYHYNVLSYDERGRVEALLRYTENIGYDAVYYSYNSMNQVTAVRTCDVYRQYVTFYGYDHNGRVDSVWTKLVAPGGNYLGLAATNNLTKLRCPAAPDRPDAADIVYRYNHVGQIDSMLYPPVDVLVRYAYDHRKWLDSLVATKGTDTLFRQALLHDNAGQITRQIARQYTGGSVADTQQYSYDGAYRLTRFDRRPGITGTQPITERYYYDKAGNRDSTVFDNHSTAILRNDYTLAGAAGGSNRLAQTRKHNPANALSYPGVVTYGYDSNGAVNLKQHTAVGGFISGKQEFVYSYRGLLRRLGDGNLDAMSSEVRYRYSPSGEREQKRLIAATVSDSVRPYPWVYYLLGAHNQQLAVYHGQQKNGRDIDCPDSGRRVYMYPFEYLTYGNGTTANISTDPNGVKEFHIMDHLGSTRVGLNTTNVDQRLNYEPFGNQIPVTGVYNPREGYIGKEKDVENQLHDFGVRKYDDETGRFLSGDILWERHAGWTPYNYAANNPVRLTDPLGLDWLFFNGKELVWYGGNLGDVSHRLYVFKATSGALGHQTAREQILKNFGPAPEGKYTINLAPSPYRFAPTTADGSQLRPNKTGGGVEKIPNKASDEQGNITDGWPDWGNMRAALQPMKGTDMHNRTNVYLHDSHKGYSHGCIETETMVFVKLIQYRAQGNSEIQVKIEYPSPDASTNGGTKQ